MFEISLYCRHLSLTVAWRYSDQCGNMQVGLRQDLDSMSRFVTCSSWSDCCWYLWSAVDPWRRLRTTLFAPVSVSRYSTCGLRCRLILIQIQSSRRTSRAQNFSNSGIMEVCYRGMYFWNTGFPPGIPHFRNLGWVSKTYKVLEPQNPSRIQEWTSGIPAL